MKSFLTPALLVTITNVYAQDATKVEQYCQVVATARLLSNNVTIDVDYGRKSINH